MSGSNRTGRVADFLKKELGSLIQQEMRDPRVGMTSVTDVEVSRDLTHARVYVTVMGKENEQEASEALKVLNKAAGFFRSRIARDYTGRITPTLKFVFDTSVRRGEYMSRLIEDAIESDHKHHHGDDQA